MVIENRDPAVGTKLIGRYRKAEHTCEVVQTEEGIGYQLADGRTFKSPSSAASAVMGGVSANGWRFWTVAGEGGLRNSPSPTGPVGASAKPTTRRVRRLKKLPNQKGVPEGKAKWFCSGCMESFLVESGTEPGGCPKGQPAVVEDELALPD